MLGASGFFGSRIAAELAAAGIEVLGPERSESELLDPAGLNELIAAAAPAAVVNAAGMTSPASARANPSACFAVNAGGALNLLEALRQRAPGAQLVSLSSAAVYAGSAPFDESSATAATTPYAASKLAMETICGQYRRGYGIPVTVLRCFNLIGPGEPSTQASSEFVRAALAAGTGGRAEVEVGEPATARDFTDVRDAARAVRRVLEEEATGTLNLCSGKATSLAELAALTGELTGVDLTLRGSGTGRPASGLLSIRGDFSKLRELTGWRPGITLERSLTDLIESLRP